MKKLRAFIVSLYVQDVYWDIEKGEVIQRIDYINFI